MLPRLQARLLRWRRRFSRSEWLVRHLGLSLSPDEPHARGLLIVQIDGLGKGELEHALHRGRMPFLRRLLAHRGYELHTLYSGLPSSTPAVQGELHYGLRTAVPAFSFLDRQAATIGVMMQPESCKTVESRLAAQAEGLLQGGSSWSNIYTGGAGQQESHFCGASIGPGDMWRAGRRRATSTFALLHAMSFFRLLALLPLEFALAVADAFRGIFRLGYSWKRELVFIIARVFVVVGLREVVRVGASVDLARGLPVIHVNFLGYDEQSHRRGPHSAFAHWTLRGIDRAIRLLWAAARRSGRRDYDVWIMSDHGQIRARPASRLAPGGLEELVARHWHPGPEEIARTAERAAVAPPVYRSQRQPSFGQWLGGPGRSAREARLAREGRLSAAERERFAITAMGPVGHIYLAHPPDAAGLRRLAEALVRDGVPGVLLRRGADRAEWITRQGTCVLPDDESWLPHAPAMRHEVARDLAGLCHHACAGDLVALGWNPHGGPPLSFAEENGAHAGPSPEETTAFVMLPHGAINALRPAGVLRPATLRAMALRLIGRSGDIAPQSRPRPRAAALPGPARLRVLTYNTHGCHGSDGRVSPGRIARVLDRCDADVIALQELDAGRRRSRSEDQLELIARELGLHALYCPAVSGAAGHYGHGWLSRTPLELVRRGRLPGGGRLAEPREAIWVRTEWEGRPIQLIGTHLGLGAGEQAAQVEALLGPGWLGAVPPDAPLVLCGDFNFPPGSRPYRRLVARLHDVQAHAPQHVAKKTFPSIWPLRRIDHVFVSPHFVVSAVKVPRDALLEVASDHLPVCVDLLLDQAPRAAEPAGNPNDEARMTKAHPRAALV